jgi:hypothetical protein
LKNCITLSLCSLIVFFGERAFAENTTAENTSRYILLGEPNYPMVSMPYRWLNKDQKIINTGVSDKNGHAIIQPQPGVEHYYLLLVSGYQFPVSIDKQCWQQSQNAFESCIHIGVAERSPELIAEENKADEERNKKLANKKLSVDWVYDEIKPEQINAMVDSFLSEHDAWWQKNQLEVKAQIDADSFNCIKLNPALVKKAPVDALNQIRDLGDANKTRNAYINAAKKGNWIAASRLTIEMLNNEDWESATPVIAWMMHHKVPTAYNRMAELIDATNSYESGSLSAQTKATIESLVWHGAMLGDPSSQHKIAQMYQNKKSLSRLALTCATEQRPDYPR